MSPEEINALERYYPEADLELGVYASQISDSAAERHIRRYNEIASMLSGFCAKDTMLVDAGCGSGYGTKILTGHYPYTIGVDVNDTALAYARRHYPECRFTDLPLVGEAVVFCESLEHMSPAEAMQFIGDRTRVIAVSAPVVEKNENPHHVSPFSDYDQVLERAAKMGFKWCSHWTLWTQQLFTTGETGDQFVGLFLRGMG